MGHATQPKTIKAARKPHRCSWCNHRIDVGQSYQRWRWFDGGDASTCHMHPECVDAMDETYRDDPDFETFSPGENPRGCNCGFDAHCERCKANRENPPESE